MLLLDVSDELDTLLTDHVWTDYDLGESVPFPHFGDVICFEALVVAYEKGRSQPGRTRTQSRCRILFPAPKPPRRGTVAGNERRPISHLGRLGRSQDRVLETMVRVDLLQ
jgi:hypothetical protein